LIALVTATELYVLRELQSENEEIVEHRPCATS